MSVFTLYIVYTIWPGQQGNAFYNVLKVDIGIEYVPVFTIEYIQSYNVCLSRSLPTLNHQQKLSYIKKVCFVDFFNPST